MRHYTPKRDRKRWLEGAPEYVLSCLDNGGKSHDRYTILIGGSLRAFYPEEYERQFGPQIEYLAMSGDPTHPQGFSQWASMPAHARYSFRHEKVRWLDLPEHIRNHVIARCEESVLTT